MYNFSAIKHSLTGIAYENRARKDFAQEMAYREAARVMIELGLFTQDVQEMIGWDWEDA